MSELRNSIGDTETITLFEPGADHFGALRDQDARKPGRVQLRILQDGKVVFDNSLTEFDKQNAQKRAASAMQGRDVAVNDACSDDCDAQYMECLDRCDQRGSECAACWDTYENCMSSCPTCNDWYDVSRTRIGRRHDGSMNILGVQYCHFEEYYLVEQANAAGCYPNRTICDTDNDTIFYGFGSSEPDDIDCCSSNENSEFWCGGDTTTCD